MGVELQQEFSDHATLVWMQRELKVTCGNPPLWKTATVHTEACVS